MPLHERLRALWPVVHGWLDRWVRRPLPVLGMLLAAGLAAWAVVRLVTLGLVPAPPDPGPWPQPEPGETPARPEAGSESKTDWEKLPETPEEVVERRRGNWILGLAVGTLLVLVLTAVVAQTLVRDNRPADYFQPVVNAHPMPGANLLQGYHWVDQNAGVVQIPIDHAMDLLVQRGLPARSPADAQGFQDEGQGGPSDASGGRMP